MGCFHSKSESLDLHPNIFRVVNIDETGADLCSGQLEITDTDIALYREGRDTTVWPLHSLRRYGYETDIFSFESGRRCQTGEGIYAFRCRRASLIFSRLQQQIQQRNVNQDSAPYPSTPYPVSRLTNSNMHGRQTLQTSIVHLSSVDNGEPDNLRSLGNLSNIPHTGAVRNISGIRASSGDLLEGMRLYPHVESNGNPATNVYQLRDFKREHNNNQNETTNYSGPEYCNDMNRDIALIRKTRKQETTSQSKMEPEGESQFLENRYMNDGVCQNEFVSPTLSNSSEHYAKLSLEQQESMRLYVNVACNERNLPDGFKYETVPTTPLTPKQVDYYNITLGNTYANLSLGEVGGSAKNIKDQMSFSASPEQRKFSGSEIVTSPVEECGVNYAVLDIDANKDGKNCAEITSPEIQSHNSSKNESIGSNTTQPRYRLSSQCSVEKTIPVSTPAVTSINTIGYTTIDFDKTVALKCVAFKNAENRNGRLNSSSTGISNPVSDKNKANST